ncbi:hypothetical protein [Oryza sativa Japonica Group]|uniref:Transposon protein, putative, unclassified n=1 Tax=Oryza sativa subsp. japonica TaxID=39947 RepID=Q5ZCM9_ORYSJ|nr:hypothetical protein [Oryza sativa Japonica Group]
MSWHRAGVLLLGAQSCLPVPGVPAVGGIGSVLLSMARMGWKLCHVFRLYTVVQLKCGMVGLGWLGTSWDPGSGCQFGLNHRRPWVKAEEEFLEDEGFGV